MLNINYLNKMGYKISTRSFVLFMCHETAQHEVSIDIFFKM